MIILNGLTQAGLLFMIASGLTLAFGLMRVVNMSHGAFYLLGGFIGVTIYRITGIWWTALLGGGISLSLISLFMERVLLVRIRGNMLSETLLTVGFSKIIADLALFIWGGRPLSIPVPDILNPTLRIFGIFYPGFRIFILVFSILIGLFLFYLLYKTKLGAIIRAGVDDREIVSAMGIDINKLFSLVFMLSGFLVGIAGVIGGSYLSLQVGSDVRYLVLALVVVIIGGMGSVGGAVIGALFTGLVLSFGNAYLPHLTYLLTFAPMILVLAIRPQGIFGRKI